MQPHPETLAAACRAARLGYVDTLRLAPPANSAAISAPVSRGARLRETARTRWAATLALVAGLQLAGCATIHEHPVATAVAGAVVAGAAAYELEHHHGHGLAIRVPIRHDIEVAP